MRWIGGGEDAAMVVHMLCREGGGAVLADATKRRGAPPPPPPQTHTYLLMHVCARRESGDAFVRIHMYMERVRGEAWRWT